MWRPHYPVNLESFVARIPDAAMREQITRKLKAASPGAQVTFTPAEAKALETAGAAKLIGLDGATLQVTAALISAGGMNLVSNALISAGGMNFSK